MEMDLKQAVVVRLNFHNYDLWKIRTKQVLVREGLWRVIVDAIPKTKTDAWIEKDEKAAATIGYLVENSQLQLIKDASSAKETWSILENYHVKQSAAGRVGLIKKLSRLELEEEGNLEEHLIEMDMLFDKLKEVGCEISDDLKGGFILASLPDSYDSFVTMMEGQESGFTMKPLRTKLLNESDKRQHKLKVKEEKAMKAAAVMERKVSNESKNRVCFECRIVGHIRKNCYRYLSRLAKEQQVDHREKKIESTAANSVTQKESVREICFTAATRRPSWALDTKWLLDSGASRHMTGEKRFFTTFSEQCAKVELADGKELISVGIGTVTIKGFSQKGITQV